MRVTSKVLVAQALLATGSSPSVPGVPGLAEASPLTSPTDGERTCVGFWN